MRYLSVCSGIEAATVAWEPLGWEAAAFAEIEKFPGAVLRHHYPDVPNAGDFTQIKGHEYGAIELLVGGTPCQDFSVAGLRAGMAGARGQLTVEFARLAGRIRPRWLVWENVPGVLSIDGGRAFGAFLGLLGELGYGVAYRVLDAQHFGVPQRRRRVFVVGYLGDWRRAAAVLFERESLSGHPAPRREAGKEFTHGVAPSLTNSGRGVERGRVAAAVTSKWAKESDGSSGNECQNLVATGGFPDPAVTHSLRADGFDASEDRTGRGTPLVPVGVTIHGTSKTVRVASFTDVAGALCARVPGSQGNSSTTAVLAFTSQDHGADAGDVSPTLRAMGHDCSHADGGGQVAVAIQNATRGSDQNGLGITKSDVMYTLDQGSQHAVMTLAVRGRNGESSLEVRDDGTANAVLTPNGGRAGIGVGAVAIGWSEQLTAHEDMAGTIQRGGSGGRHDGVMTPTMAVRRLTPRECERLQGFPDDYTKISDKAADGPRYKALGNSMAVPVMRWLGERMAAVEGLSSR